MKHYLDTLLQALIGCIALFLFVFGVFLGTLPPDEATLGCMTDTECEELETRP